MLFDSLAIASLVVGVNLMADGRAPSMTEPVQLALKLEDISVDYRVKGRSQQVLNAINFQIAAGEAYPDW